MYLPSNFVAPVEAPSEVHQEADLSPPQDEDDFHNEESPEGVSL